MSTATCKAATRWSPTMSAVSNTATASWCPWPLLWKKLKIRLTYGWWKKSCTSWYGSSSNYLQGFIHDRWLFGISSINSMTCILLGESLGTTIKNTALLWTWNSNPARMCVCVWLKKLLLKRMLLEQRPVAKNRNIELRSQTGDLSACYESRKKNRTPMDKGQRYVIIPIFIIHLNHPNLGPVQQPSARDSVPFLSYYQGKLVPGNFGHFWCRFLENDTNKPLTGWWIQPCWKISVKLDHFPK